MAKVKGVLIQAGIQYAREKTGDAGIEGILRLLAEHTPITDPELILSFEWYPIEPFLQMIRPGLGLDEEAADRLARSMGSFGIDEIVGRVYRSYLCEDDPNATAEKLGILWPQIFDSGRIETVENEPGRAVSRLTGFESPDPILCSVLCGSFARGLEVSGAGGAQVVHPTCVHTGAPHCEFLATWQ